MSDDIKDQAVDTYTFAAQDRVLPSKWLTPEAQTDVEKHQLECVVCTELLTQERKVVDYLFHECLSPSHWGAGNLTIKHLAA